MWAQNLSKGYMVLDVKLGSGPSLPLLKVRFWTDLKVRFWIKIILAYFYIVSSVFVQKLVLCVFGFADCYQPLSKNGHC